MRRLSVWQRVLGSLLLLLLVSCTLTRLSGCWRGWLGVAMRLCSRM